MGNPSTYTEALATELCQRVLTRSLNSVCQDEDMPAQSTVYVWLGSKPEFLAMYNLARTARSFGRAEQVHDIVEGIKEGKIKPDAGRAAIDGLKWLAGVENQRVFGHKATLSHEGNLTVAQLVAASYGAENSDKPAEPAAE